jgi:hypothetical protein
MMDEMEVETIPGAVRAAPVVQTEEVQAIEQPKEGIVFMVPGAKEAYAHYPNDEDWVDGYLTMVDKISESKKFSVPEKLNKLDALYECNEFIADMIRTEKPGLWQVMSTGIGKVKQELALALRDGHKA